MLNKVDLLPLDARCGLEREYPDALHISALDKDDGMRIRGRLLGFFDRYLVRRSFSIPHWKYGALAAMREQVRVLSEEFDEYVNVTVAATPEAMGRLAKELQ